MPAARLHLAQPQVSKHLKVLRQVDLVRCRTVGRHRLYHVNGPALRPLRDWVRRYEALVNEHYDRLDDYLAELQEKENP
jgi:DNA-binding transcriptional ArsR family regulator